ncbi:MAG: hypothetical protein ACUVQT_01060 [bacterium]
MEKIREIELKKFFESLNINPKVKIFICAGEPSGDLYASYFIKNFLEKENPRIFGVGGAYIKKTNTKLICGYENLKTLGFASGMLSFVNNYRVFKYIVQEMYKIKPQIFIAVAYPGLNLLLCRYAKKMGARIIYLIPPQIWAWGNFRKYFLKKWSDLIISVFPFEYQYYRKQGMRICFWQNPLIYELKKYKRTDFKMRIGLMPGSRLNEIKRNLPIMMKVIQVFNNETHREIPNIESCIILHPDCLSDKRINDYLLPMLHCYKTENQQLRISLLPITEDRYQTMRNCDFLIICSGTASLEASFMKVPHIFFNRPNFFDYHIFRHFIKLKEYNLSNLYFEKHLIPSFVIHNKDTLVQKILEELHKSTKIVVKNKSSKG